MESLFNLLVAGTDILQRLFFSEESDGLDNFLEDSAKNHAAHVEAVHSKEARNMAEANRRSVRAAVAATARAAERDAEYTRRVMEADERYNASMREIVEEHRSNARLRAVAAARAAAAHFEGIATILDAKNPGPAFSTDALQESFNVVIADSAKRAADAAARRVRIALEASERWAASMAGTKGGYRTSKKNRKTRRSRHKR